VWESLRARLAALKGISAAVGAADHRGATGALGGGRGEQLPELLAGRRAARFGMAFVMLHITQCGQRRRHAKHEPSALPPSPLAWNIFLLVVERCEQRTQKCLQHRGLDSESLSAVGS
jgi:hypothetical protein